jgi:hypothetical protein
MSKKEPRSNLGVLIVNSKEGDALREAMLKDMETKGWHKNLKRTVLEMYKKRGKKRC